MGIYFKNRGRTSLSFGLKIIAELYCTRPKYPKSIGVHRTSFRVCKIFKIGPIPLPHNIPFRSVFQAAVKLSFPRTVSADPQQYVEERFQIMPVGMLDVAEHIHGHEFHCPCLMVGASSFATDYGEI
jgi:hypothetical protein